MMKGGEMQRKMGRKGRGQRKKRGRGERRMEDEYKNE